ncbi:MAG TPA: ABC transporter permease, partial [Gammaproteobacteria bacterium]|nr:ABC transporter permease [Gammaproteobacteria bacterium]
MSVFTQIGAVTAMNLRSIPRRLGSSCVIVIGIAGVVGVVVSVLGMTQSLSKTLVDTGRTDRAVVLRNGADSELASTLLVDAVLTIKDAPGLARTPEGNAAASEEMITAVNLLRKEDGTRTGVTVRGVAPEAFVVRPEVKLVEGRLFRPGLREMIVGSGAYAEFQGVEIGSEIGLRDSKWTVVGVFESGGDAHESGMMVDAATLLSAYQRTAVNSVTVLLESDAAFEDFKTALTTNPTLSVSVEREDAFYERQSESASGTLNVVAMSVGAIMALGALFGALNTMYSAVSTRTVEIATLRAIGFGAGGVVVSVLAEALVLAVLGALLGAAIAWVLFSGNTISLGGGVSSMVVQMQVTPGLLGLGIAWACAVGFLGGLFPA